MKKNHSIKIKNTVSTAIIMTVLTLMLAGCRNGAINTADASITPSDKSVTDSNVSKENTTNYYIEKTDDVQISDGEYELFLTLTGGSGKATVTSPSKAVVSGEKTTLTVEWSSPNYDYMIVDSEKFLPVNDGGNSIFEIPINGLNGSVNVIADTVAMDKPHEIEYVISYTEKESDSADNNSLSNNDYGNKTSNKEIVNSKTDKNEINTWQKNHQVTGKLEREYAQRFAVTFYDDNICMIVINEVDYYMINGNGYSIPSDIPKGITVIDVPLNNIDLVSQSTIDYFSCIDAFENVSFTSVNKKDCENEELLKLMEEKKVNYAGKYSAPDYELLLAGGCKLVIENTMITHTPDVIDQLHNLGISTLIDYSSHEPSPLGRMEWIKLYGLLNGKLEQSVTIFNDKASGLSSGFDATEKKTAYFYVSENGGICVRKNQDYIVNLIGISGGKYAFDGLTDFDGTGQMTIQKEAFYKECSDCDVLIYNSTINGGVSSKEELASKCEVIKNTKAYKENNIYCTNDNIYLSVMSLPEISYELNCVLNGKDTHDYFYKLK